MAVGTTKKSTETRSRVWLRRNERQLWDGGFRRCGMYRDTLASETSKPSLSNSPWMRGARQVGFSRVIRRMSVRISASIRAVASRAYSKSSIGVGTVPRSAETSIIARSTRFEEAQPTIRHCGRSVGKRRVLRPWKSTSCSSW